MRAYKLSSLTIAFSKEAKFNLSVATFFFFFLKRQREHERGKKPRTRSQLRNFFVFNSDIRRFAIIHSKKSLLVFSCRYMYTFSSLRAAQLSQHIKFIDATNASNYFFHVVIFFFFYSLLRYVMAHYSALLFRRWKCSRYEYLLSGPTGTYFTVHNEDGEFSHFSDARFAVSVIR